MPSFIQREICNNLVGLGHVLFADYYEKQANHFLFILRKHFSISVHKCSRKSFKRRK